MRRCFKWFETGVAERTAERGDEMVVIVHNDWRAAPDMCGRPVPPRHNVRSRPSERGRLRPRWKIPMTVPLLSSQRANTEAASPVKLHMRSSASLDRRSDVIDDCASLRFEVVDESASVLPIDEGAGPGNRGETLANFPRGVGGAAVRRRAQGASDALSAASPSLISINSSVSRLAPSASRFWALSVFFGGHDEFISRIEFREASQLGRRRLEWGSRQIKPP